MSETLEDRVRLVMGRVSFVREGLDVLNAHPVARLTQEKLAEIQEALRSIADEMHNERKARDPHCECERKPPMIAGYCSVCGYPP